MLLTERPEPHRSPRKRRRSWREPLPAPGPAPAYFEGLHALDEALPQPVKLVLWQLGRDVQLWGAASLAERLQLFSSPISVALTEESASELTRIARALRVLAAMVERPGETTEGDVAVACLEVSEWADISTYEATAAWFAELAASVRPSDSILASAAGRANRRNADFARARRWFEVAADRGRIAGDQAAYAEALVSWGNMEYHRARYSSARRLYFRCWRKAKRYNLREMGAAARHNLLALELECERFPEANEHAAAAVALHGPDHPRLPYLAHDIAQLWAEEGYYRLAFTLFRSCVPFIGVRKERVKLWANLGRAAAGAGDHATFYEAWDFVTKPEEEDGEHLAEALVNIGLGAQLLNWIPRAVDVATRALRIGEKRNDPSAVHQAERLLRKLREGEPPRPLIEPPDVARALANRLLRALEEKRTAPG